MINDIKNIEAPDFAQWLDGVYMQTHAAHIHNAGLRYFRHFADQIFDAHEQGQDIETVITDAKNAGLPEGLIKTILASARAGYDDLPGLNMAFEKTCDFTPYYILINDRFIESAVTETDYQTDDKMHVRAGLIWSRLTNYIWQGCRIVLCRDTMIEETDPIVLDTGATVQNVRDTIVKAWFNNSDVIDVYCLRSGWDEPLLDSDINDQILQTKSKSIYA